MPSSLDPSQINSNYPLAGVNNSSQGFRDNFAFIKETLNRAKTELNEIRIEGIFKNQLSGETLNNDMKYTVLKRPQLIAYSETIYDHGSVGLTVNLDFLKGNFQKISTTNDLGVTFSNFPDANQIGRLTLWVYCSHSDHQIQLPSSVLYGIGSDFLDNRKIVFPTIGDYLIEFISVDNGVSYWIISISGLNEFGGNAYGGAGSIQLPIASTSQLGAVKIDGTTIGIQNGVISIIGGIPATSDQNLKTNITTITNSVDTVKQLRGVEFDFRDTGAHSIGVIAQEVETVLPELVAEHNGIKTVDYGKFAGVFIEAIKSLESRITELESELAALKNR